MRSVNRNIVSTIAAASSRSASPRASRSALPAATTSSIVARAMARSAASPTTTSVVTPPAATHSPLKGMFQHSFSQRARRSDSTPVNCTRAGAHSASARSTSDASSSRCPTVTAPYAR